MHQAIFLSLGMNDDSVGVLIHSGKQPQRVSSPIEPINIQVMNGHHFTWCL
jgi:hypothetical protein